MDYLPSIIIDNGSYECRAGWSNQETLDFKFRNRIAKPRRDRKKGSVSECSNNAKIQIGNEITNVEGLRLQIKSQFDRDVVTHFLNQELIFDYIFKNINVQSEGSVAHPIVITEALGNPNICRQSMNELLFECYGVPALTYGIDSIFSWHFNKTKNDGLILSFGYHVTHIIPVLNGKVLLDRARRLNIGGYNITTYMLRLMQIKYPVHLNSITVSRIESLFHLHGSIVVDYQEELKRWNNIAYYEEHVKKIKLPHTISTPSTASESKKKYSESLKQKFIKKSEEKIKLENLYYIKSLYENDELEEYENQLKENKISSYQELEQLITSIQEQINLKTSGKKKKTSQPPPGCPVEIWIEEIKIKRNELLKSKQIKKARRQEDAKRHTPAAQQRMRIISLLSAENRKEKDEFGLHDNDWNVYKFINRENESDSDSENEKLGEYDKILRDNEVKFKQNVLNTKPTSEHYELHLGIEYFRAPELLFQPSMIGCSEAGLIELVDSVLKNFLPTEQQRMVENIFITGGCAHLPGLKSRILEELRKIRPFQSLIHLTEANSFSNDAWYGSREFSNITEFSSFLTTKTDYNEYGAEYLKSHYASNIYRATPTQEFKNI